MADKKRGICPVCGQERDLTNAGVMRMHLGADATHIWRDNCAGVGCPPSSIVVDPVAAAESRGRAAGYAEAAQALRDLAGETSIEAQKTGFAANEVHWQFRARVVDPLRALAAAVDVYNQTPNPNRGP